MISVQIIFSLYLMMCSAIANCSIYSIIEATLNYLCRRFASIRVAVGSFAHNLEIFNSRQRLPDVNILRHYRSNFDTGVK